MEQPTIQWVKNDTITNQANEIMLEYFNQAEMEKVRRFHRTIPQYRETSLHRLDQLADALAVAKIFVKDESQRFGLNAFKVLGASYAMSKRMAMLLNREIDGIGFNDLKSGQLGERLPDLVFAATTDGNHGKGVAWVARELGYPAVIHMPKGTTRERYNNIRQLGAEALITEYNYDDTVDRLAALAEANHWLLIQDTECRGCREVPRWIMQGYGTMALEMIDQLHGEAPTHLFLQAGVGAFAAVMTVIFKTVFGEKAPAVILVEPNQADCFYRSMVNGRRVFVTGGMESIMAGLCCGVPNPVAWEILRRQVDCFVSVPDWVTANGMRILGNPLRGDPAVTSGESGAVSIGLAEWIARDTALRDAFGISRESKIITISTEGDTDQEMYRKIVWYGGYADERGRAS